MRAIILVVCVLAVAVSGRMQPIGPALQPDIELSSNAVALVETAAASTVTQSGKQEVKFVEWILLGISLAKEAAQIGLSVYQSMEADAQAGKIAAIHKGAAEDLKNIGGVLTAIKREFDAFAKQFGESLDALEQAYAGEAKYEAVYPAARNEFLKQEAQYAKLQADKLQKHKELDAKHNANEPEYPEGYQERLFRYLQDRRQDSRALAHVQFSSSTRKLVKVAAKLKVKSDKGPTILAVDFDKEEPSAKFSVNDLKKAQLTPSDPNSAQPAPFTLSFHYGHPPDIVTLYFINQEQDFNEQQFDIFPYIQSLVHPGLRPAPPVPDPRPVPPAEPSRAARQVLNYVAYSRMRLPSIQQQAGGTSAANAKAGAADVKSTPEAQRAAAATALTIIEDGLLRRDDMAQLDVEHPGMAKRLLDAAGVSPGALIEDLAMNMLPGGFAEHVQEVAPWAGVAIGMYRLQDNIRAAIDTSKGYAQTEETLKFAAWELVDDTRYNLCMGLLNAAVKAEREALVVRGLQQHDAKVVKAFERLISTLDAFAASMRHWMGKFCVDFLDYQLPADVKQAAAPRDVKQAAAGTCPVVGLYPAKPTDKDVVKFTAEDNQPHALAVQRACDVKQQPLTSLLQYHYTPTDKHYYYLHYSGPMDHRAYMPVMSTKELCTTAQALREKLNKLETEMNSMLKVPVFPILEHDDLVFSQIAGKAAAGVVRVRGAWVANAVAKTPEFKNLITSYVALAGEFRGLIPMQLAADAQAARDKVEWGCGATVNCVTRSCGWGSCTGGIREQISPTSMGRPAWQDWDMILFSRSIGAPIVEIRGAGASPDCAALVQANVAAHEKVDPKQKRRTVVGGWTPPANVFVASPAPGITKYKNTFVKDICYVKDYTITSPPVSSIRKEADGILKHLATLPLRLPAPAPAQAAQPSALLPAAPAYSAHSASSSSSSTSSSMRQPPGGPPLIGLPPAPVAFPPPAQSAASGATAVFNKKADQKGGK